jgi:hypothetical protein
MSTLRHKVKVRRDCKNYKDILLGALGKVQNAHFEST